MRVGADAADVVETRRIVARLALAAEQRIEDRIRIHLRQHAAILRAGCVGVLGRHDARSADHVGRDSAGIAGNKPDDVPRHETAILIIAAASGCRNHDCDLSALVELFDGGLGGR